MIAEGFLDLSEQTSHFDALLKDVKETQSLIGRRCCSCVRDIGYIQLASLPCFFGGERPEKIYAQGTLLSTGVDDLAVITLT